MSTFDETSIAFIKWFTTNGGMISDKIMFKDYSSEGAGRGLAALADIEVRYQRYFCSSASFFPYLKIHFPERHSPVHNPTHSSPHPSNFLSFISLSLSSLLKNKKHMVSINLGN